MAPVDNICHPLDSDIMIRAMYCADWKPLPANSSVSHKLHLSQQPSLREPCVVEGVCRLHFEPSSEKSGTDVIGEEGRRPWFGVLRSWFATHAMYIVAVVPVLTSSTLKSAVLL